MIRSYQGKSPLVPASAYVDESAQLIGDVTLGENASVWMCAVLRGDVHAIRIGANSNVQDCSVLHGMRGRYPVVIGEWVTIGHSVTLHGCTIGDRCLIGMGAIILNNGQHVYIQEANSICRRRRYRRLRRRSPFQGRLRCHAHRSVA